MTNVSLPELAKVFLKLGILGFGGPAAHIAMMRDEVVERRNWISGDDFFDLVGATNLIPGPNSTELAIHIGHKLHGIRGMFVSGASFILPAFFAVLSLAVFYQHFGSLPELMPVMTAIRPVIVSIVILALLKFRDSALRNWQEWGVAFASLVLVKLGLNEILTIFSAGFFLALIYEFPRRHFSIAPLPVFLFFLKIGSVLFGSGYVLLAFLQNDLVKEKGWMTSAQLLDAVTVGQVTPGPVFTTATFIGFLLSGYAGAVVATIGIFLPSFFFVAVSAPYLSKLRSSNFLSNFLNGVNAASFALMALLTFELGVKSIISIPTAVMGIVSLLLLNFAKVNSAWPILAAGLIGYFLF